MMLAVWAFLAYLTGSIPTSLVAGKLVGVDLREQGSKNLGATNVYRVLGWRFAIPVGIIDIAKGAVPVLVYAPQAGSAAWVPVLMGFAAVLGHVFSAFVRFKGGKGVATAAGAVLGMAPVPVGIALVVWAITVWATGYVSLGSILGAASFPVSVWLLLPGDTLVLSVGLLLAGFIIFTHRGNVGRLLSGTENRFGRKRSAG